MRRTKTHSDSLRTGGGYLYKNRTKAQGLDTMFQHNNSFPWTQHSAGVAAGPRFQPETVPGQEDVRKARLEKRNFTFVHVDGVGEHKSHTISRKS